MRHEGSTPLKANNNRYWMSIDTSITSTLNNERRGEVEPEENKLSLLHITSTYVKLTLFHLYLSLHFNDFIHLPECTIVELIVSMWNILRIQIKFVEVIKNCNRVAWLVICSLHSVSVKWSIIISSSWSYCWNK